MDLMEVSNSIEKRLKEEGYCGERWGSGCTMFENPTRDIQFGFGDKIPTQEFINSITPQGFKINLKLREDNFSIYVQKIETEEERLKREKTQKKNVINS